MACISEALGFGFVLSLVPQKKKERKREKSLQMVKQRQAH